jgi:hypothetical protein
MYENDLSERTLFAELSAIGLRCPEICRPDVARQGSSRAAGRGRGGRLASYNWKSRTFLSRFELQKMSK